MRLKVTARAERPVFFPYNYCYEMHCGIVKLLGSCDLLWSRTKKNYTPIRFFTFSKLKFDPHQHIHGDGFHRVENIEFYFSARVHESQKEGLLRAFRSQPIQLQFPNQGIYRFFCENVSLLSEQSFQRNESFIALSPIVVTRAGEDQIRFNQHCLNYMNMSERTDFTQGIYEDLVQKWECIYQKPYQGDDSFFFYFDTHYIQRKQEKISKLIRFQKHFVKGMLAPFSVIADPELIQVGYQCGFGEKNKYGFGMVKREKYEKN